MRMIFFYPNRPNAGWDLYFPFKNNYLIDIQKNRPYPSTAR